MKADQTPPSAKYQQSRARDTKKLQTQQMYHLFSQHNYSREAIEKEMKEKKMKLQGKQLLLQSQRAKRQLDNISEQIPIDGELRRGTQIFMSNCAGCHEMETARWMQAKAPSLALVYMRQMGSERNFPRYSSAMLQAKQYWTALRLYEFMKTPFLVVPQTTCGLVLNPITSDSDRSDLIFLLREHTREVIMEFKRMEIQRIGYDNFQNNIKMMQTKTFLKKEELQKRQPYKGLFHMLKEKVNNIYSAFL